MSRHCEPAGQTVQSTKEMKNIIFRGARLHLYIVLYLRLSLTIMINTIKTTTCLLKNGDSFTYMFVNPCKSTGSSAYVTVLPTALSRVLLHHHPKLPCLNSPYVIRQAFNWNPFGSATITSRIQPKPVHSLWPTKPTSRPPARGRRDETISRTFS